MIAISAALVVEIYGFTLTQYALIFACAGISILIGAAANRWLVTRFEILQILFASVVIILFASMQLLIMAWLNYAPF